MVSVIQEYLRSKSLEELWALEETHGGLEEFERMVALETRVDVLLSLGREYDAPYSVGTALLRRAVELGPDNIEALYQLGFHYYMYGERELLNEIAKRVRRLQLEHPLAYWLYFMWDTENEEKWIKEVIRLTPKDAKAWFNLIQILLRNSRFDEAKKAYETAVFLVGEAELEKVNPAGGLREWPEEWRRR